MGPSSLVETAVTHGQYLLIQIVCGLLVKHLLAFAQI